jgi:hypothetical protein
MEVLNEIPVFIRDFGVFVTILLFAMLMLKFSPFAFRVTGEYTFVIGRNGNLRQIAEITEGDHAS